MKKIVTQLMFVLLLMGGQHLAYAQGTLSIATWNMEHLAFKAGAGCEPRSDGDYVKLSGYAHKVDADIFALQEVENQAALERVFPRSEYTLVVSQRADKPYPCRGASNQSTPQRVAYAVRNEVISKYNLSFAAVPEIGLNGSLRYGLELVFPQHKLAILNVHLKSGCFDSPLDSSKTCRRLARQLPEVGKWSTSSIGKGNRVMILGDFNRRLTKTNDNFITYLSPSKPLNNSMKDKRGCHPKYRDSIDHILYTDDLSVSAAKVFDYGNEDGTAQLRDMLSDHCPIMSTFTL